MISASAIADVLTNRLKTNRSEFAVEAISVIGVGGRVNVRSRFTRDGQEYILTIAILEHDVQRAINMRAPEFVRTYFTRLDSTPCGDHLHA